MPSSAQEHDPLTRKILSNLKKEIGHKPLKAISDLVRIMAKLRSPTGCPWDREQDHSTLRYHAVEEVYELIDSIEAGDDHEMVEELGDLLLQVVFHCQLARERKAFDFEDVCLNIVQKLVRRHPHVFGDVKVKDIAAVWANWDKIKRAEKEGTRHERASVLDGVPRHMPALMRADKLVKKARKAGLLEESKVPAKLSKKELSARLLELAVQAQANGWNAEDLLQAELRRRETTWRRKEKTRSAKS